MVRRLAEEKALSVASRLRTQSDAIVVIAADTTVVTPDGRRVLGKPVDLQDAERMLKLISGKTHQVLTGYCLLGLDAHGKLRKVHRLVRSRVTIRTLSLEMIRDYVASGEPMDKAGSYAAQGFGMNFIESLRGSYTNVVGLPMCELLMDLEKHFGVRPRSIQPVGRETRRKDRG